MNIEQLSELSYKDLQSKAKALSIAANQKKDVLIQEIFSLQQLASQENCENGRASQTPCKKDVVLKLQSTPAPLGSRATRSTVKKVQPEPIEAPVTVTVEETANEDPVAAAIAEQSDLNVVDEESVSPVEEVMVTVASPAAAPATPAAQSFAQSASKTAGSVRFTEENEVNILQSTSPAEFGDEEEEQGSYPDPTTLFEEDASEEAPARGGLKIAINRHVYFTSPDGKSQQEGLPANAEDGAKHLHFASPELSMGKGVHWTYESFDAAQAAAPAAATISSAAAPQDVQEPTQKAGQAKQKLSPGHNDRVMAFWLTKGFADAKFFK